MKLKHEHAILLNELRMAIAALNAASMHAAAGGIEFELNGFEREYQGVELDYVRCHVKVEMSDVDEAMGMPPTLSCQYTSCPSPVHKNGYCQHHFDALPAALGGKAHTPEPLAVEPPMNKGAMCLIPNCHYFALTGSAHCGQHQPNLKVRAPYDDSPIMMSKPDVSMILGVCHWDHCHSPKAAQSNHCVEHHHSHGNGGWSDANKS